MLLGVAVKVTVSSGATVTVVVACCVPAVPAATSVYVVVWAGVTVCVPVLLTVAPFNVTVDAFCVCQESVAVCPAAIVLGVALNETVGCAGAVDVAGTVPAELVEAVPPHPSVVKTRDNSTPAAAQRNSDVSHEPMDR